MIVRIEKSCTFALDKSKREGTLVVPSFIKYGRNNGKNLYLTGTIA